ncbi:putative proteasome subunit beta type-2 [Neolecta irregularis DAH-3]|uniref:proteasome endopeptidase complex n=1 Tax=Neolecta irregularis (strain DAH-3) TaxID=1198029 RepID=A0A1U7LRW1_NEOID|nr:putative proteasome subunit beta type-2 [Neolecta irregularis DAH-3]|eukprot:OLL25397.1 putative proteasome subunit beta type-2 [Neolecta irregularis DAH-3]
MVSARLNVPNPGFDFDNYQRNALLAVKGQKPPKTTSTGTTIVGCLYKADDGSTGVCIGADTRATSGPIVADPNCEKIHKISANIWCCGAGTAADTEFTTNLINSQLELHSLWTGRRPRVVTALTMLKQHLFKHQGHIGAYLVLGGVDPTGAHLFTVHAHGSTDKLPFVTMGSGSLAAISVFETRWVKDLSRIDAMELVKDAIEAGIFNDLGSGSNCDVCVIEKDKTQMYRHYSEPNERQPKQQSYKFPHGTTAILKSDISKFVTIEDVAGEDMEVDT